MACLRVCTVALLISIAMATPARQAFWKGTAFDRSVEEMRSLCAEDDPIACLKFKAISFLDTILQKDIYKLSDNVEISRNSYQVNEITGRSDSSAEDFVENYLKSHDATFKIPIVDSTITLGARNLDSQEIDLKLNFENSPVEARKSKLKKIVLPILVFILLKAITLVPLALGVLGLKAWNALQLSFFSFVVAVGLAVFQLCKKIASDHQAPQIAAHPPWEPAYNYAARNFDETNDEAQKLAYSSYVPQ